jgi:hypothetical protein
VVLEAGEQADAQRRMGLGEHLADGARAARHRAAVEEPEAGHRPVGAVELGSHQLQPGARPEHHRTTLGRPVQAAIAADLVARQQLRAVLATAEEVQVGALGDGRPASDRHDLVGDPPPLQPPAEDHGVAPVAVGAEQLGGEDRDADRARAHPTRPFSSRPLAA